MPVSISTLSQSRLRGWPAICRCCVFLMNVLITRKMPGKFCLVRLSLSQSPGVARALTLILNSQPCLMILSILSLFWKRLSGAFLSLKQPEFRHSLMDRKALLQMTDICWVKLLNLRISLLQPGLILLAFNLRVVPVWRWLTGWIKVALRWISGMWMCAVFTPFRPTGIICQNG